MKSNFAEHLISAGHTYENIEKNMTILYYEKKGEKMNVKEDLYTYNISKKTLHKTQ